MRDRSGCSSLVSESLNTFWKVIFGFGGISEDLLCLGAMVCGRGPSISAPKSLVLGCAIFQYLVDWIAVLLRPTISESKYTSLLESGG